MKFFEGEGNTEMSEGEQMMPNVTCSSANSLTNLAKLLYHNYITQQQNAKSNGGLTADKNSFRIK